MTKSDQLLALFEAIKSKATIEKLKDSTKKFDKGFRQENSGSVVVTNLSFTPYAGVNRLNVSYETAPRLSEKGRYGQIQFFGVGLSGESDNKHQIPIVYEKSGKGKGQDTTTTWYLDNISASKTLVSVKCSCPDYRFVFSKWNKDNLNAHIGKVRPYKRKTTTRPLKNPKEMPGMCIHLMATIDLLTKQGYIE